MICNRTYLFHNKFIFVVTKSPGRIRFRTNLSLITHPVLNLGLRILGSVRNIYGSGTLVGPQLNMPRSRNEKTVLNLGIICELQY
jgi:hypothetical protein